MPPETASGGMSLATIQQSLVGAICDGADAGGLIAEAGGRGARGLAVYRHAYRVRLREALADNYSVFARALGDEAFARLADAYAEAHPPTAAHLRSYGDRLDDFLAGLATRPDGQDGLPHPALRDLARMDRALRDAFDAEDARPLEAADLAALPAEDWADLPLRLLPSARRIALEWAVEDAWHLLQQAEAGEEPALPVPEPHPHTLLVWRPDQENRWRSVTEEEAALLDHLEAGCSFGSLGDWLAQQRDDPAEASVVLVGWLRQWLADGCLSADAGAPGSRAPDGW